MENLFKVTRTAAIALALVCLVALCIVPASAQNYPPTWVYARDYNYFAVVGQQQSTFTFNGPGACTFTPSSGAINGIVQPFFDFSGNVPNVLVGSGAITSGSAVLTGVGTTFTAAMVGELITVPGAGPSGQILQATILTYTSGTSVTLNTTASTTVTAATPITVYTPVYFPVAITDATPSLSEVVTPTSTTQGATTCGFAASPSNTHISFTLQSGTSGLQEAVASGWNNPPTFDVVLDKTWYQLQAALGTYLNGSTAAAIIPKITGTTNVAIVDTTTTPWTFYTWNGTAYVPNSESGSGTAAFTSVTPVAAPTALTTVAATCAAAGGGCITVGTTGGAIPSGAVYTLAATYVTAAGGETLMSIDTAAGATTGSTTTATSTISVSSPEAVGGAAGYRLWMTAASGATVTEILYSAQPGVCPTVSNVLPGVCALGSTATISAIITGTRLGPSLTGATTSVSSAFIVPGGSAGPLATLSVSYPPFAVVGASLAAASTVTIGQINLPAGFLNVLGRTIRVCGNGFAASSGTGGTLTVATKLASLFGTTSVTPVTIITATDTASQTISLDFCETWVTTATGTSGTVEAHGLLGATLAGTAVVSMAGDNIVAASSTVDLTKQDLLYITMTPGAQALSATGTQLRQLTFEVLQ